MKIRKGDMVVMIAGKDRGKTGTVLAVLPKREQVLVEGTGMVKKHQKSRRRGQQGQIVDRPSPIHISNVAIKAQKSGRAARIGYRMEDGKKVRVARPSGEKI